MIPVQELCVVHHRVFKGRDGGMSQYRGQGAAEEDPEPVKEHANVILVPTDAHLTSLLPSDTHTPLPFKRRPRLDRRGSVACQSLAGLASIWSMLLVRCWDNSCVRIAKPASLSDR